MREVPGGRGLIEDDQVVQVAREAGATLFLAGRIGRMGDENFITWRLVDTHTGESIRANRIDGPNPGEIVDRIHDRGIAHLDLRSNNNIVVRQDGRVFVLDFASAVRLKPGGLAHRLLFSFLRNLDLSGLLKWKLCLQPSMLTADEQRQLARHDRLSAFWIVNRKRKKGPVPDASGQNDPPDGSVSSDGA